MVAKQADFNLIEYLAETQNGNGHPDPSRIPSLTELSKEKGVSIGALREQLGVARALGLVEVRPRTGIRLLPYTFGPAVNESLTYAIALDRGNFDTYSDLRKHIEAAYWNQAVEALTPEDHADLTNLMDRAWDKLHGTPIHLPHAEHRQLHLTIFQKLENPFVFGLLEAYWDAYEEVGLNRYAGLDYLEKVWQYHREMVDAIRAGDLEAGHKALVEHFDLIDTRPT